MSRVVLASGSPRRREIMQLLDVPFEVIVSDADESTSSTLATDVVMELSMLKAVAVSDKLSDNERLIVIGSDTVVAKDNKILGKPKDKSDAYKMIKSIAGDVHSVYTGVAIIIKEKGKEEIRKSFYCDTKVFVNPMTEKEIEAYISTDEPYDKAGAYGIQGRFSKHVSHIEGDYFNVVGLPISMLYDEIKEYI